jgi:hypothetical protein
LFERSDTVGVGSKNENSFAQVRRPALSRAEHVPFRIEPERGQGPLNSSELVKEPWHVLHEDDCWS